MGHAPARRTFVLLLFATACSSAPRCSGPVTDHFDGQTFRNLGPYDQPSGRDFVRWQLSGRGKPWPGWVERLPDPSPPSRVESGLRITMINHATTLVQMDGVNLVTDPVWSDGVGPVPWLGPRRHKAVGVAFDALPTVHVVLISHDHYDHLDLPTLRRLAARDRPVIFAGLGTAALLAHDGIPGAVDLDWWQTSTAIPGLAITFAPAQHWSQRSLDDRDTVLWGSFFVKGRESSVFYAGDTGWGPHFAAVRRRLGAPTAAILPIGAYEPRWFMRNQHIDPAEAVKAHLVLGAGLSVGVHWGTFDLSDEAIGAPARAFRRAARRAGLPAGAAVPLDNGQWVTAP